MNKKQATKGKEIKKELPKIKEKRNHRITFMLNETENKAVERHLMKYKIKNKSNWFRRIILAQIWLKLEEDYPMLFNENEMQR